MIYTLYLRGFLKPKQIYHISSIARELILYDGIEREETAGIFQDFSDIAKGLAANSKGKEALKSNINIVSEYSTTVKNLRMHMPDPMSALQGDSKTLDSLVKLYKYIKQQDLTDKN